MGVCATASETTSFSEYNDAGPGGGVVVGVLCYGL